MIQKVAKKTSGKDQPRHLVPNEMPAKQSAGLTADKSDMLIRLLGRLIARRWLSKQQARTSSYKGP